MRSIVLKGFASAQTLIHSSGLVRINHLRPVSSKSVIAFWLALLWMPILLLAATATPEQLLNWPAMFAIGIFCCIALLLGPFAATPWLLKKVARVAISIFFLKGLWFLLRSKALWALLAPLGLTRGYAGFALMMAGIAVWSVFILWVIFSREPMPRASGRLLSFPLTRPLF